jgi:hypothetical protein
MIFKGNSPMKTPFAPAAATLDTQSAAKIVHQERKATGVQIPELDPTQKKVIATLAATREFWQIPAQYVPKHTVDSLQTRYEKGWVCGALLARAHARTDDIAKIAGYIGKTDAFADALAYGDQTEADQAALVEAIRRGRVEAQKEGV